MPSVPKPPATEPADRWRIALSNLDTWKRGEERAVHKPLLTLILIARAEAGQGRDVSFREVSDPLRRLLREFGPSRDKYQSEYPFWHLQSDGFWEVRGKADLALRKGGSSPSARTLLTNEAIGAVPEILWKVLSLDAKLRWELASNLLDAFWPATLHESLRLAIGLPSSPPAIGIALARKGRDPAFREAVLRAYQKRCAICGYDGRLADIPLGIEAAHVRWHAHNGPDDVSNGLALCSFHHVALDSGALSVNAGGRITVSSDVTGSSLTEELVYRFDGSSLRKPLPAFLPPAVVHFEWHWKNVFKRPGRSAYPMGDELVLLAAEDQKEYGSPE